MNTRTKLYAAGAGTIVGLAAFAGVASAQAAPNTSITDKQTLVDKIASTFNLNKDDVQKVFDEDRATHEAEFQQVMEDRLDQAVTDGKITSDQKAQILAKQQEMKAYMESLKDKTETERRELMKAKMDEMKQWAEDNNLSGIPFVMGIGGHHMKGGMPAMFKDGEVRIERAN